MYIFCCFYLKNITWATSKYPRSILQVVSFKMIYITFLRLNSKSVKMWFLILWFIAPYQWVPLNTMPASTSSEHGLATWPNPLSFHVNTLTAHLTLWSSIKFVPGVKLSRLDSNSIKQNWYLTNIQALNALALIEPVLKVIYVHLNLWIFYISKIHFHEWTNRGNSWEANVM